MVGRIAKEKNVELGLRAFERARARRPETRMVVVGDGPARRRLEAAHPEVRFVGVQRGADLAAHYASGDVFLFPSLSDTFGNVVMEALASALPVVVVRRRRRRRARRRRRQRPARRRRATKPRTSPPSQAITDPSLALASMRAAALAAARRATWPEVLVRFEARLEDTAHALEAPSPRVPVVA